MNTKITLTKEEKIILDSILEPISIKAGQTLTLPILLQKWGMFVSQVENGYDNSIYEYMNDLEVRNVLQEIIENGTTTLVEKLFKEVQKNDNRFKSVSIEIKKSLKRNTVRNKEWWWFRIPINPGIELKNDLQLEDLI